MNILIAMDSFKGSLTSLQAGEAVREGIQTAYPKAQVTIRPIADGGEGTMETLTAGMGGEFRTVPVTGPLGGQVEAKYGIIKGRQLAIMEMSQAAGIVLVPAEKRNPLYTTTYGVGELILDAIGQGCKQLVIGIGGSATNDGGVGMLQALGFHFLDVSGNEISRGAIGLKAMHEVRMPDTERLELLRGCHFSIACDVTNPLFGPQGCSAVYGPQKGATPEMVEEMDKWLMHYAFLTEKICESMTGNSYRQKIAYANIPGAGAAGGLGYAFAAFLQGELLSGIQLVFEKTGLEEYVKQADLVITGEGRMDGQTAMGKVPVGVAKLAKKYQLPVLAFCGSAAADAGMCNAQGIDAYFPIIREPLDLDTLMEETCAKQNLTDMAEQVMRIYRIREGE